MQCSLLDKFFKLHRLLHYMIKPVQKSTSSPLSTRQLGLWWLLLLKISFHSLGTDPVLEVGVIQDGTTGHT